MRWSKIKNIIILLLAVVNVALLVQVGAREWRSRRDARETRERMAAVLERAGVAYLPGSVPGELALTGYRVTPAPFGEAEAQTLVGTLSGFREQGGDALYDGSDGRVTHLATGELAVEFTAPLTESALLERLEGLGVSLRETARDDAGAAYLPLWEGAPILTPVRLSLREGQVRTVELPWLSGEAEPIQGRETIDAATALTRFLDELNRGEGYVCSQITDMSPCYTRSGTSPVTLTPAWRIETDTWRFTVDGYTGAVTAEE